MAEAYSEVYDLKYYRERHQALKLELQSWLPHYRDLSDFISPRMQRFLVTDRNRGDRRNQKIIDNTATLAVRTMTAGMMSGMTSPARPWFVIRTPDPALNERLNVRAWLDLVRARMLEVFLRSNLYTTLPLVYEDLGIYGTTAFLALDDDEDLIRFYHWPIGSYALSSSARGKIDTAYREYQMTARQLFQMFGKDNCSSAVRTQDKAGNLENWNGVVHAVQPNPDYDPRRAQMSKFKAFKSCWFEAGTNENKFLREAGYDRFRVLAPRWKLIGEDVYGCSPGMEALGDIRALQLQQKRKQQVIDKVVNPPMGAPSSLRTERASVLPGDVTYWDGSTAGGQKFEPLYVVDARAMQYILQDNEETRGRVKDAFYEKLFLLMANDDRSNVTAREIAERHEEKLQVLGPVIEHLNDEMLDPLIDMTFESMARRGVIPPAPPELQGAPLAIEYISIMAQALKMVGVSSIERFMQWTGTVATVKPEVLDLINFDESVKQYHTMIGAPATIIYDSKYVDQVRAFKQRQQQMMQTAAAAPNMVDAVKTLSETQTTGNNALAQALANMRGAQGAPA